MTNAARKTVSAAPDPEVETAAKCALSALAILSPDKRAAAEARLFKMLAAAKPKVPQRGGTILDNVVSFLRMANKKDCSAAEVVEAVAPGEPKKVYSALTYLKQMKIIKRVGYGRYLIEGGGLLLTHERNGD